MIIDVTEGRKASFFSDDRILLGEGLFETVRVEQRRSCYSKLHWQRICQGATCLGIAFDLSYEQWCEQLQRCIEKDKIIHGGIKVILSGGQAPRGLDARGGCASLVFEAFTYSPQQNALSLVSAPWRRDAQNPVYQLKSVNYLESIIARRQALAGGADDALFFNLEHHATETTVANLFIIKQDTIFTPTLADGVLAGITRGRILHLSMDAGLSCIETAIDNADIKGADVVFVSNALQGICVIKSFDGHRLSTQHPVVDQLRQLLIMDETRWG